jgi:hypothetical protein
MLLRLTKTAFVWLSVVLFLATAALWCHASFGPSFRTSFGPWKEVIVGEGEVVLLHYRATHVTEVPFVRLLLLFAIAAAWPFVVPRMTDAIVRWERRREGHRRQIERSEVCPKCGYDLRATPDRCPECGREIKAQM